MTHWRRPASIQLERGFAGLLMAVVLAVLLAALVIAPIPPPQGA